MQVDFFFLLRFPSPNKRLLLLFLLAFFFSLSFLRKHRDAEIKLSTTCGGGRRICRSFLWPSTSKYKIHQFCVLFCLCFLLFFSVAHDFTSTKKAAAPISNKRTDQFQHKPIINIYCLRIIIICVVLWYLYMFIYLSPFHFDSRKPFIVVIIRQIDPIIAEHIVKSLRYLFCGMKSHKTDSVHW